jgi:hypothetical protein
MRLVPDARKICSRQLVHGIWYATVGWNELRHAAASSWTVNDCASACEAERLCHFWTLVGRRSCQLFEGRQGEPHANSQQEHVHGICNDPPAPAWPSMHVRGATLLPPAFGNKLLLQLTSRRADAFIGRVHPGVAQNALASELGPLLSLWTAEPFKSPEAYGDAWRDAAPTATGLLRTEEVGLPSEADEPPAVAFHFRCGDVPFNSHPHYRMPSDSFVRWATREALSRLPPGMAKGRRSAVVLWCAGNTHRVEHAELCLHRAQQLAAIIEHAGNWTAQPSGQPSVRLLCTSDRRSIQLLRHAGACVSLVPSTFSFVACVDKGARYITPLMPGVSLANASRASIAVPWTMWAAPHTRGSMVGSTHTDSGRLPIGVLFPGRGRPTFGEEDQHLHPAWWTRRFTKEVTAGWLSAAMHQSMRGGADQSRGRRGRGIRIRTKGERTTSI